MKETEGKVAFITGGSSGIGLGIAQAFVEAGMKVVIGYRSEGHADQAMALLSSAGSRVHAIRVDVTDHRGMDEAAAEVVEIFGKVHVLVNNAGVQNRAALSTITRDEWDLLMRVNVCGVLNGVHAFLPRIRRHGEGGHVVTTASIVGLFTAGAGYAAYCASKFAAVAMMESLRAELTGTNIGVSVLCPGPVRSNLEEFLKDFKLASDPVEIGRHLLRGMQRNDLYVLTHPEFNSVIQYRNDTILAATPESVYASAERLALAQSVLERSVYFAERKRALIHETSESQEARAVVEGS